MNVTFSCRLKNKTATPLPHSLTTAELILGCIVTAAFALLVAHVAVGFFLP